MKRETLFERMSRIARQRPEQRQLIDALDAAGMCRMPAAEQLRFRAFLEEEAGIRRRTEPRPLPPVHARESREG